MYKSNNAKCDIIRPHNHKAVPMRELNHSLMNMLEKLVGKEDVKKEKNEVLLQLKELSNTIDDCIESLNIYDSKRFVNNEIQTHQRLLESLKHTNYEDPLNIKLGK